MPTRRPEFPVDDLELARLVHQVLAPGASTLVDPRVKNPMLEPEPETPESEGVVTHELADDVVLEEERVWRGKALVLERITIRGTMPRATFVVERARGRTLELDAPPALVDAVWHRLDVVEAFYGLHQALGAASPVAHPRVLETQFHVGPRMFAFAGDRGLGSARQAEKVLPTHPAGPACAAILESRVGQHDAALRRLHDAYARMGRDPQLVLTEAMVHLRRGAPDEALARVAELENALPRGRHTLEIVRIEAMAAAGRFEEAAERAIALRTLPPHPREHDRLIPQGATLLAAYLWERAGAADRARELLADVAPPRREPLQAALWAARWRESPLATALPHEWLQAVSKR